MKRTLAILLALWMVVLASSHSSFAEGIPGESRAGRITTNDPEFIPLEAEKSLEKGISWYWYALGVAVIAGVVAVMAGGGGGDSGSSTGSVTGTW